MAADLRTRLGHVELPNPILTASGCAAAGVTQAACWSATRWTSGASRRSSLVRCYGCVPR